MAAARHSGSLVVFLIDPKKDQKDERDENDQCSLLARSTICCRRRRPKGLSTWRVGQADHRRGRLTCPSKSIPCANAETPAGQRRPTAMLPSMRHSNGGSALVFLVCRAASVWKRASLSLRLLLTCRLTHPTICQFVHVLCTGRHLLLHGRETLAAAHSDDVSTDSRYPSRSKRGSRHRRNRLQ
jgi:hypothetical protein